MRSCRAAGDPLPVLASEIIDSGRPENGVAFTGSLETSRRFTKRRFFTQVSRLPFDLGGWRFYTSYGSCRVPFRRSRASPLRGTGLVFFQTRREPHQLILASISDQPTRRWPMKPVPDRLPRPLSTATGDRGTTLLALRSRPMPQAARTKAHPCLPDIWQHRLGNAGGDHFRPFRVEVNRVVENLTRLSR